MLTLEEFIAKRVSEDVYPEEPSELHNGLTEKTLVQLNSLISLEGKKVLDIGCGQGLALELFKKYDANAIGITLGEDLIICRANGYRVYGLDLHHLDQLEEKNFDFIYCRHAIEHSLYPLYSLYQISELLRPKGSLFIEVPAPDTISKHEFNPNHYSCFSLRGWYALFLKAGFRAVKAQQVNLKLHIGEDYYFQFLLEKD